MRENLKKAIEDVQFDGAWEQFKTKVYNTSVEVLGLRKRKHRDWFDENDPQISKLLEDKNQLHQKYLSASGKYCASLHQSFRSAKSSLQCRIRQMKYQWWSEVSKETQKAYDTKDSKALYHLIRQQSLCVVPIKSKDGFFSTKIPEGIMKRWTEHSTDLFYNP